MHSKRNPTSSNRFPVFPSNSNTGKSCPVETCQGLVSELTRWAEGISRRRLYTSMAGVSRNVSKTIARRAPTPRLHQPGAAPNLSHRQAEVQGLCIILMEAVGGRRGRRERKKGGSRMSVNGLSTSRAGLSHGSC